MVLYSLYVLIHLVGRKWIWTRKSLDKRASNCSIKEKTAKRCDLFKFCLKQCNWLYDFFDLLIMFNWNNWIFLYLCLSRPTRNAIADRTGSAIVSLCHWIVSFRPLVCCVPCFTSRHLMRLYRLQLKRGMFSYYFTCFLHMYSKIALCSINFN